MIHILLPAFNEEASLPKLLPKIKKAFDDRNEDFRLLVVDDGSTDKTAEILAQFKAQSDYPIEVLTHPINRGLGETERDGFEYISNIATRDDIIVRVEGDDTHDPKYIFELIAKLKEGFDVVNTSRFQPGGEQLGLNNYRKLMSRLANGFMKIMFNIKGVKDYSCGFRAYKASIIKDAVSIFGNSMVQLRGLGFTSTLELIVKLKMLGCTFAEVPFVLRYDLKESPSKMVSSVTTLGYFTMALLYHWPFGGWKRQYKGLSRMYQDDADKAIKQYQLSKLTKSLPTRIGV